MKGENKKLFLSAGFLFLICLAFIFKKTAWSYDTVFAHPMLTEKSVTLFNNQNTENKLSAEEAGWIIQGAIDEDAVPRWMNHFYNPNSGLGLTVFMPANIWANSSLGQAGYLKGDQSWQAGISAYAAGDKKKAFVALGHILHLIEDMAVPAHTRIDAHPEGDPYEKWVKLGPIQKINNGAPVAFNNLNDFFNSLANYSNKYFLSKDTVQPNLIKDKYYKKNNFGEEVRCIKGIDNNVTFCLAVVRKDSAGKEFFIFDEFTNSDYYSLLAPKAISYGAGVIDLFFKQVKLEENKKLSALEKIKQIVNKTTGKLISDIAGLFGKYQAAMVDYSENLAGGNAENNTPPAEQPQGSGQVLSAQETAGEAGDSPENVDRPNPPLEEGQNTQNPIESGENKTSVSTPMPDEGGSQTPLKAPSVQNDPAGQVPDKGQAQPALTGGNSPVFVAGDGVAPETIITSAPNGISNSRNAVFIFSSSENNSIFECALDSENWSACGSPKESSNLTDGEHVFKVRAADLSNNFDPTSAESRWIVDTIAPLVSIAGAPPVSASSSLASFSFEADEANAFFSCNLDLNGWLDCLSPKNYENLSQGEHNFKVKAIDEAGNISSTTAEYSWNIRISPPQVTIVSGPPDISSSTFANFQFTTEENYTGFQCNLDGVSW